VPTTNANTINDNGFNPIWNQVRHGASLIAPLPILSQTFSFDVRYPDLTYLTFHVNDEDVITQAPTFLSGGGGLASTLGDYHRFAQMLARGGELDGVRLLGPRTLAYATRNHLPGNADLETVGRPIFAESAFAGTGFGLGFSVVVDPAAGKQLQSQGEYGWGGLASTTFTVFPEEDITVVFMTQLMPSSTHPIRPQLRTLVSQAVVS